MGPYLFPLAVAFAKLSHALRGEETASGLVDTENVIRYPVIPLTGASVFGKHSKRQQGVDAVGRRSGTIYTINLTFGSPGQTVPVQFDTGSSELWVNPVCSKSRDATFCQSQPRFTYSTSLIDLGVQGNINIEHDPAGDGAGYVDFSYVADFVGVGSARVSQQIFGAAYDSSGPTVGNLGAGPDLSGWKSPYPSVIDSLRNQGFTQSRAFSMDLQGVSSTAGSVIFGGIDTMKYRGSLVKLPIVPSAQSPDGYTRYWIRLDSISVVQPGGAVVSIYAKTAGGIGQVYVVDSGHTLSALPSAVFEQLVAAFPSAQPYGSDGLYSIACLDAAESGSLDFTFAGSVISVPYSDFVWRDPSSGLCVLGAFADDAVPVLGDTFLRAAYVVFDWDNQNIHLAQSDNCGTNLVPISTGVDAVPSIIGGCAVPEPTSSSTSMIATSTSSTESSMVTTQSTAITDSLTSAEGSSSTSTSTSTSTLAPTSSTSSASVASSTTDSASSSNAESSTIASETNPAQSSSTSTTSAANTSSSGSSSDPVSTAVPTLTVGPPAPAGDSTASGTASSNSDLSSTAPEITITFAITSIYTITSCAPEKTACRPGAVVTETLTSTATFCPEESTAAPPTAPKTTWTTTRTTAYTITSCSPGEKACRQGQVTTEVMTSTTTFCPQTTGTYKLPNNAAVTVVPGPSGSTPIEVPGCTPGAPPPPGLFVSSGKPGTLQTATGAAIQPTQVGGSWAGAPTAPSAGWTAVAPVDNASADNATAPSTAKATPSVVLAGAGRAGLVYGLRGLSSVALAAAVALVGGL